MFLFNMLQIWRDEFLFLEIVQDVQNTCSPLQRVPYLQQATITIVSPLMIPKPKHLDSLLR